MPALTASPYLTLAGCVISVASLSVALSAPLVRVAGLYDLHLFPRNDVIDYDVSRTHLVSQIFHILALGLFIVPAMLLVAASSVVDSTRALHRHLVNMSAALTVQAALFHLIAILTLMQVGNEWKKHVDHLPIPPPEIRVDLRVGMYLDFLSLPFVTIPTAVLAIASAVSMHRQQRFVQLD